MKIKVTYKGPWDAARDDRIRKAMLKLGAKWYAQGYDHRHKIRDLCFDWEVPL